MSGNPFRASLYHNPATSAPAPPVSFVDADDSRVDGVTHEFDAGIPDEPGVSAVKES
jgi:hypothetical protein